MEKIQFTKIREAIEADRSNFLQEEGQEGI